MRTRVNVHVQGWLLALPAVVLLATFTHVPAVTTIIDSCLCDAARQSAAPFIGLDQYRSMLADPVFWQAFENNLLYALITVPLAIGFALGDGARGSMAASRRPGGAAARLFHADHPADGRRRQYLAFFYTPEYGLLNQVIRAFGFASINFLGNPATALPALMAVTIWKEAGLLHDLLPRRLAAGAARSLRSGAHGECGRWQVFRRITWPMVMPTTLFVAINALINAFRVVDQVIAMTGGGPNNATIAAAVLHLPGRLQLLGFGLRGRAVDGAAAGAREPSRLAQFFLLDRRIHYR